jgi:hypothetical protein
VTVTRSVMRRLTIARYLFQTGVEQSHGGEMFAALAILPLHDAIELFLEAALEHHNITLDGKRDFLAYWNALEKAVPLTRRKEMERFNRARVSLKHHATLPSHEDVEDFRAMVRGFLNENSPTVFAMDFNDISLAELVKTEKVRKPLELAEQALRNGDHKTALEEAMRAFRLTLSGHRYGLYNQGANASSAFRFPFFNRSDSSTGRELANGFINMADSLGEAITVVAYNLDFDGYRYLRTYGPIVHEFVDGGMHMEWRSEQPTTDREIVSRCVRFVINAALHLERTNEHNAERGGDVLR